MIKLFWFISFYILGTFYLVEWFFARSKCKENDKWLMFTPFWFFITKSFDETGKAICRRVQIYFAIAFVLILIWKLGYIDW